MQLKQPRLHLIHPLKKSFEKTLKEDISFLGDKSELRDACEYALMNGGKRIRPIIVFMVAKALGHNLDIKEVSLSVEYFHTASLIADDLPCMDNDNFRRDKPSVHKVYGETVALLASYALISSGYEKLFRGVKSLEKERKPFSSRADRVCVLALENATRCSGIAGATGGQFLDLFPKEKTLQAIQEVIYKKTVTLFEISFIFGYLFGGGEVENLEQLKEVAYHFGMAFQIVDDLGDLDQDSEESINIAHVLGEKKAKELLASETKHLILKLKKLKLFTKEFEQVVNFLND